MDVYKKRKRTFDKLNKIDFSIVERKLSLVGHNNKLIKRMKKECLRYLSIISNAPKGIFFAPSFLVDEFWHNSILHTKQYADEVSIACGRFLHHHPSDGSKKSRKRDENAFWNTIQAYQETYGEPDLEVWGLDKKGVKS